MEQVALGFFFVLLSFLIAALTAFFRERTINRHKKIAIINRINGELTAIRHHYAFSLKNTEEIVSSQEIGDNIHYKKCLYWNGEFRSFSVEQIGIVDSPIIANIMQIEIILRNNNMHVERISNGSREWNREISLLKKLRERMEATINDIDNVIEINNNYAKSPSYSEARHAIFDLKLYDPKNIN